VLVIGADVVRRVDDQGGGISVHDKWRSVGNAQHVGACGDEQRDALGPREDRGVRRGTAERQHRGRGHGRIELGRLG
jgi:hypothetical protein